MLSRHDALPISDQMPVSTFPLPVYSRTGYLQRTPFRKRRARLLKQDRRQLEPAGDRRRHQDLLRMVRVAAAVAEVVELLQQPLEVALFGRRGVHALLGRAHV